MDFSSMSTLSEQGEVSIPPAVLRSVDGRGFFSLSILGWEHAGAACTRYDEWVICCLTLKTLALEETVEGPCLLRHEVADLLSAVQNCLTPEAYSFQSDYMETVLKISLEPVPGVTTVSVSLKTPAAQSLQTAQFVSDVACLSSFAKGLERQLEGFYSVL
jgi:hypothetical protein